MEFRILGPLEVVDDGRRLPIGGRRQRAVLAMLLLNANHVVPSERLINELWGEEPPETVSKVLQGFISQLRKALEPGLTRGAASRVLVTRAPGYLLALEPDQFDLARFEHELAEGRAALASGKPGRAAELLQQALSRWRGSPLPEFAYEEFAQAEIRRLEELRHEALEQRIEADLALGRHAALIRELDTLVAAYPLRERLRAQLMLALYRSGRQADALACYRAARAALVGELGIEPSAELQRLEQAILRHDPSLDWVDPAAASSASGAFVGRAQELGELLAGLDEASAGRGRLFLLVGEPGIGKSRLAEELSGRARARGLRVLAGRSWEAGGAPAYWPWVQVLRELIRGSEPEALRAQLGHHGGELAQIVPELRELFPDLPPPALSEREGARFRQFDAVVALLTSASAERPTLLVLDDLHAADEPSLLLLQFLARALSGSRLLVLGAYRDVDPTVRDPLASVLPGLVRESVTRRIDMRGLSASEVGRYVTLTTNLTPAEALVSEIQARSEGNPLFVAELTRLLLAEGALQGERLAWRISVPQGARDVIRSRLQRLPDAALATLTLAAVIGTEFHLSTLARLSEQSESELLDLFDEAIAARVIDELPGEAGFRFVHALIRDTLYADLTPATRRRLHERVGKALERRYADNPAPHLAELAHHFAAAVPTVEVDKAIGYARRAGDRARDLLAYEEAARLYRLALTLNGGEEIDAVRSCQLLICLGDVQARAGDTAAANECFVRAAELAAAAGAKELMAEAALGYGGRLLFTRGVADRNLVPLLERAAAALGEQESVLRVRVLARLASALRYQHSFEPRDSISSEALAVARRLADPTALAYALSGRLNATLGPDNLDEKWILATELASANDKERAFEGHNNRAIVLLARGDIPHLRGEIEALSSLADELQQPSQLMMAAARSAMLALLEGRFADADELTDRTRTVGERAQHYDTFTHVCLLRYALHREKGRLQDALDDLERATQTDPSRPLFRCALALVHSKLGNENRAQAIFSELASNSFAALPANNDWLLSAALLAEIAPSQPDATTAASLYSRLEPYAALNVDTIELSTGSIARYLGLLAAATEDLDQAADHFEHALEMNTRMGARPWLARTQHDYATLLAHRNRPGDRTRARDLASHARATFQQLGIDS